MPNRLDLSIRAEFLPEGRKATGTGELKTSFEPASKEYLEGIQTVGTTEEALQVGDVSTIGLIVIHNLSDTDNVLVGFTDVSTTDDAKPIKIRPGRKCAFAPQGTIFVVAINNPADVAFYVYPDAS